MRDVDNCGDAETERDRAGDIDRCGNMATGWSVGRSTLGSSAGGEPR
jgi:hypothetical protein